MIPKGEIAVSLGVGPHDKRNSKADMFVLGNKKLVLRQLYHHMPFSLMKGWVTNPSLKEHSRIDFKSTTEPIKAVQRVIIKDAPAADTSSIVRDPVVASSTDEVNDVQLQEEGPIPEEVIEDIWQEYMGAEKTNRYKNVYGLSKSKLWHCLIA